MRFFLTDFPDLEETAVDAIYDLCEDPSPKVRAEGYLAITQVSRIQSRWIKRNADVLVQLLQSEEVDEVAIVKRALVEHLDMDPKVTLGVLCDQIIPPNDTTDEEEVSIRERLRSLVLGFMVGEAKHAICGVHAAPGGSGESALYDGLFAAIPRLGEKDLGLVLKNLMYALPAFTSRKPNERGSELLQLLLAEKVSQALKEDLHSKTISLSKTRPALQICEHLTCVLKAAPAVELLQFFCSSLIGKITLQKMQTTDQQWIICSMARVLGTAEKQPRNARFSSLRRTIVDACPYLLEVFKQPTVSQAELSAMYGFFLEACTQRAEERSWVPPHHLLGILQEFRTRPGIIQNKDYERMIMSITPTSQTSMPTTCESPIQVSKAALPTRKSSTTPSGANAITSIPDLSTSVHSQVTSAAYDRTKREISSDTLLRPTKRTKVGEVISTSEGPTLLSRLGTSISRQSSLPDLSSRTQTASPMLEGEHSPQSRHGFSIKGAAAKQANPTVGLSSRTTSSSLLDRLQDSFSGDSPARRHDSGRRRRNV
ncbi:Apoptosis inhibitor 5-A [Leucoagaricus sp. SymC.cos]|nr:Apoptosis inhibitor 5-A [Leucoagaricus sp. SymC.cos]